MQAERIAIEGRIDCRTAKGERSMVLQWRRQIAEDGARDPARWRSVGPAIFTLSDASAVIQVRSSALMVVATGMLLDVISHGEFAEPLDTSCAPAIHEAQAADAFVS